MAADLKGGREKPVKLRAAPVNAELISTFIYMKKPIHPIFNNVPREAEAYQSSQRKISVNLPVGRHEAGRR